MIARLALPLLLLLPACSAEPELTPAEKAAAAKVPGAPPGGPAEIALEDASPSSVRTEDALIDFAYDYPREAAAIAKLAALLDRDREVKREALIAAARRDQASAAAHGHAYNTNSHLQRWERVANTPRFLSLSAEIETYSGGAHGMQTFDALIWDRNRGVRLSPLDLFASGEAFDRAVNADLCAGIERAKKAKGILWSREDGGVFSECPSASAQTVWLGSSDGRHLDRLTVAIAPYEVGPYAEGSYRIDLPMTAALVHAVKPDFAREFRPLR
ncbi:MAG TPA: DUF4163 domain-containing protein [Sphingopyxis sp.]|nr:DUF4163 domain-containing protein [Sphingopyxis sp.]HMP44478.1 DUF4163 domain-containing protein [Sphingopyxis sp.]HMQ19318.1 DUF4163 domain-containing protein [Sphingopyxis sp.]